MKYIDKALVLMAVDAIPKDTITGLEINAETIEKIPDVPKGHREFEHGPGRTMIIRWQVPAKKIKFSRQEFVIMIANTPYRVFKNTDGQWYMLPVDDGPPKLITDAVALALLNLPVFDLVKEDGTVLEDHGLDLMVEDR